MHSLGVMVSLIWPRCTTCISRVTDGIGDSEASTHKYWLKELQRRRKIYIYIAFRTCDVDLSRQYLVSCRYPSLCYRLLFRYHSGRNGLQCFCVLNHFVPRADLVLICLQWILISLDVFFYPIFVGVASVLYIKTLSFILIVNLKSGTPSFVAAQLAHGLLKVFESVDFRFFG